MKVFGAIRNIKNSFEAQKVNRKAHALAELRKERIKFEGQANIFKIEQQEKKRIAQAKATIKEARPTNQVMQRARENWKKRQAEMQKKEKYNPWRM